MDAHTYKILASALLDLLEKARIDKIYNPFPNITVFQCFGKGTNFRFAIRADRQSPGLFLLSSRIPNPQTPSAPVMRLRKYLTSLHFGRGVLSVSRRALALPVQRMGETLRWFILEHHTGPIFSDEIPEIFLEKELWPDKEIIRDLADKEFTKGKDAGPWISYPLLSPLLRESLAAMDFPEAMALMIDLEAGGADLFFYKKKSAEEVKPTFYAAWPLPDKLLSFRELEPIEIAHDENMPFSSILYQASLIEEEKLLKDYSKKISNTALLPQKRSMRRLKRNLNRLKQDEKRLNDMIDGQKDALLIQENLWKLDPHKKSSEIIIEEYILSSQAKKTMIKLNIKVSLIENMKWLFDRASKGKRGLVHTARRRKELESELKILSNSSKKSTINPDSTNTFESKSGKSNTKGFKGIANFTSRDGYTLLRGKNAQGNNQLLKLGQPYDYWLHSTNGPSAHVIIRRNHAKDEVPESTMLEAARLVAEKSWQKDDTKADIMVAELKAVRNIKGAAPGTVRVDQLLRNILIPI